TRSAVTQSASSSSLGKVLRRIFEAPRHYKSKRITGWPHSQPSQVRERVLMRFEPRSARLHARARSPGKGSRANSSRLAYVSSLSVAAGRGLSPASISRAMAAAAFFPSFFSCLRSRFSLTARSRVIFAIVCRFFELDPIQALPLSGHLYPVPGNVRLQGTRRGGRSGRG